jgi:hypothetical protein
MTTTLEWLPDDAPSPLYLEIMVLEPGGPDGMGGTADVWIEAAAAEPMLVHVERTADGRTDIVPRPGSRFPRVPSSAPMVGQSARYELGHCGIWSGIDVDGTFWDPVGSIDAAGIDLINAAAGTFTLQSRTNAVFRTNGGLVLQLVRHAGPKYLPGCD